MPRHDDGRIAVLLGANGSLPPADIMVSARGLATVCFLVDTDATPAALRTVAGALAPSFDVDFRDDQSCLRAMRRFGAGAAITFTDRLCSVTDAINRAMTGANPMAVPWGRKDAQRRALYDAGLSTVRSARVETVADLHAFVREAGFPAVVKPVDGVGSRDTWILRGEDDIAGFARDTAGPHEPRRMFAEQYIVGTTPSRPQLADYVSIEVFRTSTGPVVDSFITDRLVSAWPCRETGLMLPTALPAGVRRPMVDAAEKALDELGTGPGGFHVELKPTAVGPEIIEVNGRLGGFVHRLCRYGADADVGRLTIACALGRAAPSDLRWARCAVAFLFPAPADAHRIERAPQRRAVARMPGVVAVDQIATAGPAPDWRAGTDGAVATVWLVADDHDALFARLADVATFLDEEFVFTDRQGRVVRDVRWLEPLVSGRETRGCDGHG